MLTAISTRDNEQIIAKDQLDKIFFVDLEVNTSKEISQDDVGRICSRGYWTEPTDETKSLLERFEKSV